MELLLDEVITPLQKVVYYIVIDYLTLVFIKL